jgi:hypothetical protein
MPSALLDRLLDELSNGLERDIPGSIRGEEVAHAAGARCHNLSLMCLPDDRYRWHQALVVCIVHQVPEGSVKYFLNHYPHEQRVSTARRQVKHALIDQLG